VAGILVIRLRSNINVRHDMRDTLESLNLTRVNHAVVIPDTPTYRGMIQKVKDLVTFGTVDVETLTDLLSKRGRLEGGAPLTDAHLSANSDHKSVADYAKALVAGDARLGDVPGVKPILRLAPPRKGHEGIKHSFNAGGALGDRGDKIGLLASRMV
jgi:large subunit ribosomal protein L30